MAQPKQAIAGTNQTVNINSNAQASPRNKSMSVQDTLTFQNNDPANAATVTFLGVGAGVFSNNGVNMPSVNVPAGSSSVALSPNVDNVTVNYGVSLGANSDKPFGIEVGDGPLEIIIVSDSGNTDIKDCEIPNNGTLFFYNRTDETATINFDKANVIFDSNGNSVTQVTVNSQYNSGVLTGRGSGAKVDFTIGMSVAGAAGIKSPATGSGSIKVGH